MAEMFNLSLCSPISCSLSTIKSTQLVMVSELFMQYCRYGNF